MKSRIYGVLSKPYVVIITILIATLLSFLDRNYGYFYGLFIVLLILWGSHFDWSAFGFSKRINKGTIQKCIVIIIGLIIGIDFFLQPFLEIHFGAIDLSSIDDIRGNFVGYLIIVAVSWIFAAFGEELLFRGYYMKQLAQLFGGSDVAWFFSAIITSAYFGLCHFYQGPTGMILVGLVGFCLSIIFYKNRDNLILGVLVHGFYNMIGLTLIYLDKDQIIVDWIKQMM